MAEWAYVENNNIAELHDLLPANWRNYSGLNLSIDNVEFLNSIGWYKVTKVEVLYSPNEQVIVGYDYAFENNQVLETPKFHTYTFEEHQNNQEDVARRFFEDLRTERNKRLAETDFTQLLDVSEKFTEEEKQQWKNYRQQLRDMPDMYSTVRLLDWPNKPTSNLKSPPIVQPTEPTNESPI